MNNPSIPAEGAVFEYTPDQIKKIKKCMKNILYFAENFFYIISLDKGRQTIKFWPVQKRIMRKMRDNRFFILLSSRQLGKTTLLTIYALWTVCFHKDQKVLIVANKEDTAIEVMSRVRLAYEELPNWLKPAAINYGKTSVEFANGSKISISTTTSTAARGQSVNCVAGDTRVILKDNITGNIFECDINELENNLNKIDKDITVTDSTVDMNNCIRYTNNKYQILSDTGFQNFKGLLTGTNKEKINISFNNNQSLVCTPNHKLITNTNDEILAKDLKQGDILYNNIKVTDVYYYMSEDKVYDILHVENSHKYLTNGILSKNCLIIDEMSFVECVAGDTLISIRDKKTETEKTIEIKDTPKNSSRFEVFTDSGWRDFGELNEYDSKSILKITLEDGKYIKVSGNHLFFQDNNEPIAASNCLNSIIKTMTGSSKVISVENVNEEIVYDISNVTNGNRYYTNGILSHNTHIMNDFWRSVYPIISSSKKSKIFITSTAGSTDHLFYKLYTAAAKGESNWACDCVTWDQIPGRDEKWKQETIDSLGSIEDFNVEFNCQFTDVGDSTINDETHRRLLERVEEPKFIFDEGKYMIWDEPQSDHIYGAGVDVGEGIHADRTVIQIMDFTDLTDIKQVATYCCDDISPVNFTGKLHEVLQHWGNPLVCVERNNCGAQVVDNLKKDYNYDNIVSWGASIKGKKANQLGINAHTNTKYKGVSNMRYWVNDLEAVHIRDPELIRELKTFVRYPNGTWAAQKGGDFHDDRVMSLIWSLILLEDEVVSHYFDVVEMDKNKKPLKLQQFDFGIKYFMNPTSMYSGQKKEEDFTQLPPILISNAQNTESDLDQLFEQGWQPL